VQVGLPVGRPRGRNHGDGCWGVDFGLRGGHGACCGGGDGCINKGETQDTAAGSGWVAFGSRVVDVEGGSGGVGDTGRWGFRRVYGGGEDVVIGMWEEVAEATSPVEWGVQGVGIDGFFDSVGCFVAFPGEVCDVVRAEVVACDSGVLPNGRGVVVGKG
jgi:hypothetical protein